MDALIPAPRDDDDEDVHWALSTAAALWGRGEQMESLKWLRRAAETASDANADQRALELFKAAADVAARLETPAPTASSNPSKPPPPPPVTASVPPPAPDVDAGPPASDGRPIRSVPPPPPPPPRPPRLTSQPPPPVPAGPGQPPAPPARRPTGGPPKPAGSQAPGRRPTAPPAPPGRPSAPRRPLTPAGSRPSPAASKPGKPAPAPPVESADEQTDVSRPAPLVSPEVARDLLGAPDERTIRRPSVAGHAPRAGSNLPPAPPPPSYDLDEATNVVDSTELLPEDAAEVAKAIEARRAAEKPEIADEATRDLTGPPGEANDILRSANRAVRSRPGVAGASANAPGGASESKPRPAGQPSHVRASPAAKRPNEEPTRDASAGEASAALDGLPRVVGVPVFLDLDPDGAGVRIRPAHDGKERPEGAGRAVLMATSEADAKIIASLFRVVGDDQA